ncbi:hypothetical protein D3C72_1603210 [compost metagenome]
MGRDYSAGRLYPEMVGGLMERSPLPAGAVALAADLLWHPGAGGGGDFANDVCDCLLFSQTGYGNERADPAAIYRAAGSVGGRVDAAVRRRSAAVAGHAVDPDRLLFFHYAAVYLPCHQQQHAGDQPARSDGRRTSAGRQYLAGGAAGGAAEPA